MEIVMFLLLCLAIGCLGSYLFLYVAHCQVVYCPSKLRIDGKTILITGGTSGIGRETALNLAKRGAKLILVSRCRLKADRAVRYLMEESGNMDVRWEPVDLSDWRSVRQLSARIHEQETSLHVLINNAAIAYDDNMRGRHGYDAVFSVNYLGHFLLTYLLLDLLKVSAPSRIINVSSIAHKFVYRRLDLKLGELRSSGAMLCPSLAGYDISKFALSLHVKELTIRLAGSGVTANFLHPGATYTDLWKQSINWLPNIIQAAFVLLTRPLFMTADQAAQTTVYCSVASELEGISGKYFVKCRAVQPSTLVQDSTAAAQLWEASKLFTGCTDNGRVISTVPDHRSNDIDELVDFGNDSDTEAKTIKHTTVTVNRIERS